MGEISSCVHRPKLLGRIMAATRTQVYHIIPHPVGCNVIMTKFYLKMEALKTNVNMNSILRKLYKPKLFREGQVIST